MRDPTDEQILEVILEKGDWESGFRLLIAKYQERLYWQIRGIVGEHEDAHDVMQNTFVKVFHHIRGFEGKSRLYTWLYRIATNEAISYKSRMNRRASLAMDELTFPQGEQPRADPHLDGAEVQKLLLEAVDSLPEKQKVVFQMRYFEELSYRDISEMLGTSEGALKASFYHAVKKVETYLEEKGFETP